MRLLEAILEANHRRGSATGEIRLAGDFRESLPVVALTCIDPRLNRLLPESLGIPEDQFIWLRNAGNIVTGPLSSTMRSLALACAIKGGREITLIGHSDCQVCKTTMLGLTEAMRMLGVDRHRLPDNLVEYFGLFASERQNVMRGVDLVRSSPLIGTKVPVHGLLISLDNGRLEWVVNGYEHQSGVVSTFTSALHRAEAAASEALAALPEIQATRIKLPEIQVGALTIDPNQWLSQIQTPEAGPKPAAETKAVKGDSPGPEASFDKARRYRVIGLDQKVYGPIQGLKVLQWIAEGRIGWDTASQLEGSSEWRPLGLWGEVARGGTAQTPPKLPGGRRGGNA